MYLIFYINSTKRIYKYAQKSNNNIRIIRETINKFPNGIKDISHEDVKSMSARISKTTGVDAG